MFLTRGDLPYEPLWRAFLDSASELAATAAEVQAAAAVAAAGTGEQHGGQDHPDYGSSSGGSNTATLWQRLFSGDGRPADAPAWAQLFTLYTHPAPGLSHPRGSLFAGHEVACRHAVEWGNHSVIDAERALLRAALADPANHRFALLSESCVPLHPAPVVYAQLMAEPRSRVNACRLAWGRLEGWLHAWGVVGVLHSSCQLPINAASSLPGCKKKTASLVACLPRLLPGMPAIPKTRSAAWHGGGKCA